MLNEKLPNSKYCYDSHSCQTENFVDNHQRVKLFALRRNVNNTNGMAKLGIPLSILGFGVINSGIGRN